MNVDSGLHAGNDRKRAFFLAKIILVRLDDDQDDAQKHDRERQVRHQQRRGAGKRVADHVDVAEKRLSVVHRLGLKHV